MTAGTSYVFEFRAQGLGPMGIKKMGRFGGDDEEHDWDGSSVRVPRLGTLPDCYHVSHFDIRDA